MYIDMYDNYDIDNVDIEQEMYLNDLLEDYEDENEENEILANINNDYELNEKFLLAQQKLPLNERMEISFINKTTRVIFDGIVMGQSTTDKEKFVFSVSERKTNKGEETKKIKIFNINNIEKY